MHIRISTRLELDIPEPTDILLQIEAAHIPEQVVLRGHIDLPPCQHFARISGQDAIGERIWLRTHGQIQIDYQAEVAINRLVMPIEGLAALPPHRLPGDTVQYLMDSVYCPANRFHQHVGAEFGQLVGGAQIAAMRDWITDSFVYDPDASNASTTALESFVERRGVCRDFAHMLITFARAAAIPARYASVYAPDVEPQDFHAVAEVFLADESGEGGAWHLVDPTGMATSGEMAKIAIGRDAADASFITHYGHMGMKSKIITVTARPRPMDNIPQQGSRG